MIPRSQSISHKEILDMGFYDQLKTPAALCQQKKLRE